MIHFTHAKCYLHPHLLVKPLYRKKWITMPFIWKRWPFNFSPFLSLCDRISFSNLHLFNVIASFRSTKMTNYSSLDAPIQTKLPFAPIRYGEPPAARRRHPRLSHTHHHYRSHASHPREKINGRTVRWRHGQVIEACHVLRRWRAVVWLHVRAGREDESVWNL